MDNLRVFEVNLHAHKIRLKVELVNQVYNMIYNKISYDN